LYHLHYLPASFRPLIEIEFFSSGRAARKGAAHGYDDHRRRHQEELEQRFAAMVVERYEAIRREVIQEVDPEKG
jgi:hypothetical protein